MEANANKPTMNTRIRAIVINIVVIENPIELHTAGYKHTSAPLFELVGLMGPI